MRLTTLLTAALYLIHRTHAIPLTSPSPTSPAPVSGLSFSPASCDLECLTDHLLFDVSMAEFLSHKASQTPPGLRWDDNGCSHSPDHPSGFNFLDACKRHDFGYRNYQLQRRFSEKNRARIDHNLKLDLYYECNRIRPGPRRRGWEAAKCRRIADAYFGVVRALGIIYVQGTDVTGDNKGPEKEVA